MQNEETTVFSLVPSAWALSSPCTHCSRSQVHSVYQLLINKKTLYSAFLSFPTAATSFASGTDSSASFALSSTSAEAVVVPIIRVRLYLECNIAWRDVRDYALLSLFCLSSESRAEIFSRHRHRLQRGAR